MQFNIQLIIMILKTRLILKIIIRYLIAILYYKPLKI